MHKARKRFGQNFLQDVSYQIKIIQTLNMQASDHWLEIGPGLGALTDHMIGKSQTLDLVELDRDLVQCLKAKFKDTENLTIHSADALKFDYCQCSSTPIRLVGNLPYNISTPLVFRIIEQRACIQDAYFLLQKEVVDRMAAAPGQRIFGKLSVMVQQMFQVNSLFTVPPEAFSPKPKVLSCFVRLTPYHIPPIHVTDQSLFSKVVRHAFAQKRKTLHNNLKHMISDEEFEQLGISPTLRAETLSIEQFAQIANYLAMPIAEKTHIE